MLAGGKTIRDFSDNNWIGILSSTAWNCKTEHDPSVFYSRQNGAWNNRGIHGHTKVTPDLLQEETPLMDRMLSSETVIRLRSQETPVSWRIPLRERGLKVVPRLMLRLIKLNVWGTLNIEGQLLNGGILTGDFELRATGNIPVFDEIHTALLGSRGC